MAKTHTKPNQVSPQRGSGVPSSEPRFLAIGQITKAHGVRGEVSVHVMTDFVERFDALESVLVGKPGEVSPYQVETLRWHRDRVLMRFVGVSDRSAAEMMRGLYLQIPVEDALPLEPDAYYVYQLIGLAVVTDTGRHLGQVTEVLETGANDVYVVRDGSVEVLLPATNEVIKTVDLATQTITVHLLDGLFSG